MHQKAAICIRTSSEAQGERASPSEQEVDCRLLAAETQVWGNLYEFVMNPDFLLAQAKELVHDLQQNYESLQKTQKQLLEELEEQFICRQQVITEAHKARREDDEFAEQMSEMYELEKQLKRGLAIVEQEMDTYVGMDWKTKINDYVAGLQAGIEELNCTAP